MAGSSGWTIQRKGFAGSPTWQWLEKTNANHINLVDAGLIEQSKHSMKYIFHAER